MGKDKEKQIATFLFLRAGPQTLKAEYFEKPEWYMWPSLDIYEASTPVFPFPASSSKITGYNGSVYFMQT